MSFYTSFEDMRAASAEGLASKITKRDIIVGGPAIKYRSYERASADPKASEASVTVQNRANKRRGEENGWSRLGGDYVDNDKPASKRAKPGSRKNYERLIEDLRAEPGHVLMLFEMARGTRDMQVYLELRSLCERNGPYFWQVGGGLYDVREPGDRQALNNLASQAEGGSDNISRAVRAGMEEQRERGRPHGQTLFGYRRTHHKATHQVIAQEPDFELREGGWSPAGIVQEIFSAYKNRVPMANLVADLNERGVLTPRQVSALRSEDEKRIARARDSKWHSTMIFNILKNGHYLGMRFHRRQLVNENAMWKGIVEPETFFAVQVRLKERGYKYERPTQAQTLLTCLAKCSCGEQAVFQSWKDNPRPPVYRCRTGDASVPAGKADAFIREVVTGWASDPAVIQRITLNDSDEARQAAGLAEKYRTELARWKAHAKDPSRDDVTLEDYNDVAAVLLPQIQAAEKKATRAVPDILADAVGPDAEAKWDSMSLTAKREFLKMAFEIVVLPVGRGNRRTPINERMRVTPLF